MTDSDKAQGHPDRRRAPRTALSLRATIRKPGQGRAAVRVIDISTHGCRIAGVTGAAADSWVLLTIARLETQYCRVAWSCHEFAGIEFATPLTEPVLESLLQDQKRSSETTVRQLHDIARRTHQLALKHADGDTQILTDLSRRCAVEAVIEGLRLNDSAGAQQGDATNPPR